MTFSDVDKICEAISRSVWPGQVLRVDIECNLRDDKVAIAALDQVLAVWPAADGQVDHGGLDVWSNAGAPSGEWRILIRQA